MFDFGINEYIPINLIKKTFEEVTGRSDSKPSIWIIELTK